MPGKKKKKKSKVKYMNENVTAMGDNNMLVQQPTIVSGASKSVLDLTIDLGSEVVARSDYDKLLKENNDLRMELLKAGSDCTHLKKHIELVELKNIDLSREIDKLKEENRQLKLELDIKTEEIKNLNEMVNTLMQKEKERCDKEREHENMMTTAETCMLYERTVVKYVIGYETNMAYHELINDTTLTGVAQTRLREIEEDLKKYNSDLHDMNEYLKGFKYDRNRASHPVNKLRDKTVTDLNKIMDEFIDVSKESSEKEDYKHVSSYMLNQLKNKFGLGDTPFKSEYITKKKGFKRGN